MPSALVGSILTVNPASWVDEVVNLYVTSTNVVSTVVTNHQYAWTITLSSAPAEPFNGWQLGDCYIPLDSTWYVNNGGNNWVGPTAPPHYLITNVSGNRVTVVGDYKITSAVAWEKNISTTPTTGDALITRPRIQRKFQWYRNTDPIPGATAAVYTLSTADAGKQVSVQETAFAWNTPDSSTTLSSAPIDVTANPGSTTLVFQDNLTYLGAFKAGTEIPYIAGQPGGPTYEIRALSINPAGYNGNATMFLNGTPTSPLLGEFQIPALKNSADFNSLNNAPIIKTARMVDPTEGQINASGMNGGVSNSIWGSLAIPGTNKMIVSAVNWYTYNPTALFWKRPVDLSTTGQVGNPFMVLDTTAAGAGTNPRWTSGFMCYIPSTPVAGVNYQTVFGGSNVLSGVCGLSVASTQSAGPAAIAWNYNDIDSTTSKSHSGIAQAGDATHITLASSASAINDFYKDQYLYVSSGPGAGSCVRITAYTGTNKIATVAPFVSATAWASGTITNAQKTNPARIQISPAFLAGDRNCLRITGVNGMTQLNGNFYYLKSVNGNDQYDLYTDINLTIPVDATGYGTYTGGGTVNGTPTANSTYITYPILPGRQLIGRRDGNDLERFQFGVITPIWSWNAAPRGMCIPAGTRSLLFFGIGADGKGIYSPRYYISSQSNYGPLGYDPVGTGTGPHSYPYSLRIWAYDLDDLATVYRNEKSYEDIKPYGVFIFQIPGLDTSPNIGSVNYDPSTKRIYIGTGTGPYGSAVIHAFQVTNAADSVITTSPSIPPPSASTTLDTGVRYIGNLPGDTANYFHSGSTIPTSLQTPVSTQIISQFVTLDGLQATDYLPALTIVSTAFGSFEISINGGAFASGEQAVANGDTLRVRLTTSASYAAVGSAAISFRTVSGGADNYLLSFSYQNVNNDRAPQTFQVGPTRAYTQLYSVLNLLRAGDTVEIDSGTYFPPAYNGTLNTVNQTIEYTLNGEGSLGFSIISESGVGTITFEKFVSGSWTALTVSGSTTANTWVSTGSYIVRAGVISCSSGDYSGATKIRMRLSSYTSGTFKAAINFQYAQLGAHTLTRPGTQSLPITIKAAPGAATRPIITNGSLPDGTPGSYLYGLWVRAGSDVNFQGLEIVTDKCSSGIVTGGSTSSSAHRVSFVDCVIRDNADGLLGFDYGSGSVTLDRCWINNNGDGVYGPYVAHGTYFGTALDTFPDSVFTVRNCVYTNNQGNAIKCRGPAKIYDNWISQPNIIGSFYCIELPGLQGSSYEAAHQNYADICGNVLIAQSVYFIRGGGDGASARTNARVRYFKNTCVMSGSYFNMTMIQDAFYSFLFSSNAIIGASGNTLSSMRLVNEQNPTTWTNGINIRFEYNNLPAGYTVSSNASWILAAQFANNTSNGTVSNNTFASFDATPAGNLIGTGLTPPSTLPTNFDLPPGAFRTDFSTRVWTTQPTLYSVLTVPSRSSLNNIGAI